LGPVGRNDDRLLFYFRCQTLPFLLPVKTVLPVRQNLI